MSSAELLTCANCGGQEPAGSAFCGNCGTPFAPPEPEPTMETSTAETSPGVMTCASCGNEEPDGSEFCGNCGASLSAATEVLAPQQTGVWPEPDAPPAPAPAGTPPPAPRWRSRRVLLPALGVLVIGAALGVLFGTGALNGGSRLPESAFLRQVNVALGPLRQAVESAAQDAAVSGAFSSDGTRIVQVSNGGAQYLRVLHGLSGRQQDEVKLLLAYLAANVSYGQAFGAFDPSDSQTRAALDNAAQGVLSARAPIEDAVPTGLDLPAQESYVSSQALPPPPPPPPPPASVGPSAGSYVQQVDGLLRRSHSVVVSLGSFVPRAARDEMSRSEAVAAARSYLSQRQLELARAQALSSPSEFGQAQALLIRALQASVADDEALVAWTLARRDGTGNARSAFQQANRLGAEATRFKRQFLRVYGPLRQQATGQSPGSLPAIF